MTQTEIQHSLDKCQPMDDNFAFHTPVNPFISIVQSVGDDDPKHQGVKIHMLPPILEEWKEGKQFQLQVYAVGLTSATYTCLENRPDTVKVLKRLRNMTLNPFRQKRTKGAVSLSTLICLGKYMKVAKPTCGSLRQRLPEVALDMLHKYR
jgi:hypothetical protein